MPIGEWYIPERKLSKELKKLIPGEDTVLYTTAIFVETGTRLEGRPIKVGELAITNRGVAFFAKRKGLKGGLLAWRGGPIHEYVQFDRIEHIEGKGPVVGIRVAPPLDSDEEEKEYELTVAQSEPFEDEDSFKRRRGQFSSVLEHAMYRYRTGQAQPALRKQIKHPATAVRATPRRKRPRRVQYCPHCGSFLEEPAVYCDNCGARLVKIDT